jgi:glycosyltransferase involved in cell wall biosynthesis
VSTNCKSGPSEILKHDLSKYLVPTGDTSKLAEIMQQAIIDYPKIEKKHIEDFELDKIVNQYAQLVN